MNENESFPLSEDPRGLGVAHLEQWFGVWAMEEMAFGALAGQIGKMDLAAHVAAAGSRKPRGGTDFDMTDDGVAVINIHDTLTKYGSSLSGGGTIEMRQQVRAAARAEEVKAIVLHVDSPGGTVAGTKDLADDVAAAAAAKPVVAYIEDLGASAAYWIASQASKVYVNRTGLVGSIGTFAVINDLSGYAGQIGVKVHVLRAGAFKGAGTPGTEISAGQLAEWQRVVNELNGHFLEAVAAGRRMSREKVESLADGRVHVGDGAVGLGLADGVRTFEEVLSECGRWGKEKRGARSEENLPLAAAADEAITKEDIAMSETNETAAAAIQAGPASYAELKGGLIGADASFICKQLDAGATLAQAQAAWMTEQNARLEAAQAQARKPGVEALGGGEKVAQDQAAGDPIAIWNEKMELKLAGGMSRANAVKAVDRENPGLREAMVAAHNELHR